MCKDCPYMPLYFAIKELDVPVAGDLGCSIMTSSPPLCLIDAAFSLGSSISTACGFNRKGIAIIGDYGLAHSGIPALVNAVHNENEVVVVVLQNEVAAMTGGQKVPDLTGLLSYYIKDTVIVEPTNQTIIKSLLETKLKTGEFQLSLHSQDAPGIESGIHHDGVLFFTSCFKYHHNKNIIGNNHER